MENGPKIWVLATVLTVLLVGCAASPPQAVTSPTTRSRTAEPPTDEEVAQLSAEARGKLARITTPKGTIDLEFYPDEAPKHVANFIKLAKAGFYAGLIFHRVEPGFVIQGGDPEGTGRGGPGYTLPAEIKRPHLKGAVAAARQSDQANPKRESSGSQFYITLDATPALDGAYTVFGQVVAGFETAQKIRIGDPIERIELIDRPGAGS